jgi:GNAT superfamily N-acetyltransferase
MTSDRFRVELLDTHHDRESFSCGVESLDRYLKQQAGQDARRRLAVVFILYDAADGAIVGYYTLSATGVIAAALPDDVTKRLPRYPMLPVILIGRLAVDRRYRGQGFGEVILGDAIRRCQAQHEVAAMAVVVEAKDDAARSFYERYGFRRLIDDEYRLFLPLTAIPRT